MSLVPLQKIILDQLAKKFPQVLRNQKISRCVNKTPYWSLSIVFKVHLNIILQRRLHLFWRVYTTFEVGIHSTPHACLRPSVTQCVNYVTPNTVFNWLPELTLWSFIRFTIIYVVKYSISRRYQDISALILEVGFVMNEVVMRIGLNTVEAYAWSLIIFLFIRSLTL